jgi:adenylyltransferase/sulfurtransferase
MFLLWLSELNSDIEVTAYNLAFDSRSALDITSQYDVVLDCSDNVATR